MPEHSPTIRRRRLAAELRRLREVAGDNGSRVAKSLGWSTSKISRLETAQVVPQVDDVRALLDHYKVGRAERELLLDLARDAARKGWWEAFSDTLPEKLSTYIGLEAEAASQRTWQPILAPGLLQTNDYFKAMARPWQPIAAMPHSEIEARAQARLARQAVLTRSDPLVLDAVIDESVLTRRFGDNAVMRDQLLYMAEMARLPNVTVRVLRLDAAHPTGAGSFVLLKFPRLEHLDVIHPDVAYVEHLTGSFYTEDETETYRFEATFDRIGDAALDPDDSVHLMTKVAADVWT